MPPSPMGNEMSSHATLVFSFKWWLFIFVSVALPLDLLYRSGALWFTLTLYQLVISISVIVVCLALLSLSLGLVSLGFSWVLNLLARRGTAIVITLNALGGFFVLLTSFLGYFSLWLWKFFHNDHLAIINWKLPYLFLLMGSLIVLLAVFYRRLILVEKIKAVALQMFPANLAAVLICTLITAITIAYHQFYLPTAAPAHQATGDAAPRPSYPNIILITFDALSAKHSSLYGFVRDTTPNLAALGRESFVFDKAYASSNWTLPSCYSIITGKHPINHKMKNEYSYFWGESRKQNLPYILQDLGYETGQVWSNVFQVTWNTNLQGFKNIRPLQGKYRLFSTLRKFFFDSGLGSYAWIVDLIKTQPLVLTAKMANESPYFGIFAGKQAGAQKNPSGHRFLPSYQMPEYSFGQAKEFIERAHSPFFLWVHLFPPHDPYLPPDAFLHTFLEAKVLDTPEKFSQIKTAFDNYSPETLEKISLRYDENIRYVDHEFGNFLNWLKQKGLFDQSLIMVSSDHGEMFETKFFYHAGPYLNQILIQVPLVIHLPGQTQGKRIEPNVSQVDFAPTILDFLGIKVPGWMDGTSFKTALDGGHYDPGTKFSMNLTLNMAPPKMLTTSIAAIQGNYKLIEYLSFKRYEMYDLQKDPEENHNLVRVRGELTKFQSLKKQIDELLASHSSP
jgi:arylsulfatase A-like enzyme